MESVLAVQEREVRDWHVSVSGSRPLRVVVEWDWVRQAGLTRLQFRSSPDSATQLCRFLLPAQQFRASFSPIYKLIKINIPFLEIALQPGLVKLIRSTLSLFFRLFVIT